MDLPPSLVSKESAVEVPRGLNCRGTCLRGTRGTQLRHSFLHGIYLVMAREHPTRLGQQNAMDGHSLLSKLYQEPLSLFHASVPRLDTTRLLATR